MQKVSVVLFQEKIHYENIMKTKVLPDIKEAEANYEELKTKRKVSFVAVLSSLWNLATRLTCLVCIVF